MTVIRIDGDKRVSNLGKKRLEASVAIATYVVGSGIASAAPTPSGEIPKQILLTAADVLMYTRIWTIYFEEDLSLKSLSEILAELGLVTVAATVTAYIVSKATAAILKEIGNWTGPLGWFVTAAIAGSLSGLFGLVWAIYCEQLYSQRRPQTV